MTHLSRDLFLRIWGCSDIKVHDARLDSDLTPANSLFERLQVSSLSLIASTTLRFQLNYFNSAHVVILNTMLILAEPTANPVSV